MSETYTTMPSPVGELLLTAEDGRLTGLYLPVGQVRAARRRAPGAARRDDAAFARGAAAARGVLRRRAQRVRAAGRAGGNAVPAGVWDELQRISYGRTITYAELAARIGRPTAIRAAGAANGANPVSIVIPCHRVIGSNGTLTGYGGGLEAKRFLLDLERARRVRARATSWPARLVLLGAIWGMSFVLIKIGNRGFTPVQVSFGRMLFGLLALLPVLLAQSGRLPRDRRTWGHLFVAAILVNSAPFTLFAFGEQRVDSLLAGIWNGTTPLFVLLVVLLRCPRSGRRASARSGSRSASQACSSCSAPGAGSAAASSLGSAACLGAAILYGIGFPYLRRNLATGELDGAGARVRAARDGHVAARASSCRSRAALPASFAPGPLAAVVALGAAGTGAAYLLNYSIIRDAGATAASTVTYLVPVFATVAGVAFLSENLSWNEPVGGAARAARRRREPGPPAPARHAPEQPRRAWHWHPCARCAP